MASNSNFAWLKWLFILATLGVASAAGWKWWNKSHVQEVEYRTAEVSRGEITQVVTASGQLNPVVTVQVGSQVSGILQKILVDFNSPVTNGQVVAQLDPATFQANVHQAEGELANAEAALELARVNADRAKKLYEQKLLAQSDYDKAVADLHQAEAALKIRKAALEKSRVDLERTTIYSPIEGVVISREVDVGQTVAASLNAPTLFKIANDLSKMQIDAMVSEADIGGVELGQNVNFTVDAFPNRVFHGKVEQVRNSPVTVQNVVTYDTVIAVRNEDLKLKPGMTANVSIVVAQKDNVLKIANAALRFRPPDSTAKPSTNAPPQLRTNAPPMAQGGSPRGGGSREGRSRGGTGGTGGGGNWRGGGQRGERSSAKTVYLAEKSAAGKIQPKAAQIKTGISDGVFTEVTDGLSEGSEVIVGMNAPESDTSNRPTSNPFGGGGFRRF